MQSVPVIVISTEGSQTRIEQLTQKGVKAYLRKPVTPERLRDVVKDILGLENE
jgi:two-component system chemotaxis response regulator CheY